MMDGNSAPPRSGLVSDKIQRRHRERLAAVYIRQSTPQQMVRHKESTRLQYALVERAFNFGWARSSILVVDDDLGRSGSSIEGRPGFQRLVAEVGLGNIGLVLGVEVSRLARSNRDWHQLLEICALFDVLIADVDGVYDPSDYNDRLLLGLKGTMSEAELHIQKGRMLAGRRAKAQRGELGKAVPMGYVRHPSGAITLDPDEQAQTTIRLIFDLFERFRTVGKVMRYLVDHEIRLPVRVRAGPRKGDLEWHRVNRPSLHNLFANPIYAGAYVYGMRRIDRRRQKPGRPATGRRTVRLDEVEVCLPDRLPAYISWEQFQRNQAQLRSNMAACIGPARAGKGLLSGLLICGRCGLRMVAQYCNNGSAIRYVCGRMAADYGEAVCQSLKGAPLDALITRLVLEALEPAALEASLQATANLAAERAAVDRHWQQRRERARYVAERARRQYDAIEPENRLAVRTLERDWEQALTEQAQLEADYERFRREQPPAPGPNEIAALQSLAQDLPAVWHATTTTQEERQTLVRLMLERILVAVIDGSERVRVECHWHGGNHTTHHMTRPVGRLATLSTYHDILARASELFRAGHGTAEIAEVLNRAGLRPAKRRDTFNVQMVRKLLLKAGVAEPKYHRRRPAVERQPDEWTIKDLARHVGMPEPTLYTWVQQGRLRSRQVSVGGYTVKLVHADAATIAKLQEIRATPPPWRRRPPPLTPDHPATES
jgi:DNA invertase Pin-like site-specific DNA recombinase